MGSIMIISITINIFELFMKINKLFRQLKFKINIWLGQYNFNYKFLLSYMTWNIPTPIPIYLYIAIIAILISPSLGGSVAPFVPLDTVHQAHSQFQINLILNENRNHPIILTTVSKNETKNAAISILEQTHNLQSMAGFSILVDCT